MKYSKITHIGLLTLIIVLLSCSKKDSPTEPTGLNAPSRLMATIINDSLVQLEWQDNSSNEDGFDIEESIGVAAFRSVLRTRADVTSVGLQLTNPDSSYLYRLRAYDSSLVSSYSNQAAPAFQTVWRRTFGGANWDDVFNCVTPTLDGGILAVGDNFSTNQGDCQGWIVKVNSQGNLVWQRIIGGANGDGFESVVATADGGYLMAGHTGGISETDGWLVKVDGQGTPIWQRTLGGSGNNYFSAVVQTSDGGFLIAGGTDSTGEWEYLGWLVKVDCQGNPIWQQMFSGAGLGYFSDVIPTSDAGFLAVGVTYLSSENNDKGWLVKIDNYGDIVWQQIIGGMGDNRLVSVTTDSDGGFLAAGSTQSSGALKDGWVLKVDSQGNPVWQRNFGTALVDEFSCISQCYDSGYLLVGRTWTNSSGIEDGWLVKLVGAGNKVRERTLGRERLDDLHCIVKTEGFYLLAGWTEPNSSSYADGWLIKLQGE